MSTTQNILESLLDKKSQKTEEEQVDVPMDLDSVKSEETEKSSLEQIVETQQNITRVKTCLTNIIDTMAENPSLISRAANYFGEMPLWQRILIGAGLSVPTLALGVFAEVGVLLVLSGATIVAYTATGIVLDDHHIRNINTTERLKVGVISLADMLELAIKGLERTSKKLEQEVNKFREENLKLSQHVSSLADKMESLQAHLEIFIETEKLLRESKESLENTVLQLQSSVEDQSELLQLNQKRLAKVTQEYNQSQQQLAMKVGELDKVKESMTIEVEKVKVLSTILQGTVSTLAGSVAGDKEHRKEFRDKLDDMLANKENDFAKAFASMSETQSELILVKDELKQNNDYYTDLIGRQEKQIARLDELYNKVSAQNFPEKTPLLVKEVLPVRDILPVKRPLEGQSPLGTNSLYAKKMVHVDLISREIAAESTGLVQ